MSKMGRGHKSASTGKVWRTIICPEEDCEWSCRDEYKTASRKYTFHQKHKHKNKVKNHEQHKPNSELCDINGRARRLGTGGGFSCNHSVPAGFNLSIMREGEGHINSFKVKERVNVRSFERASRGDEEALKEVGRIPIVADDELNFLGEVVDLEGAIPRSITPPPKKKKKKKRKKRMSQRQRQAKKKTEDQPLFISVSEGGFLCKQDYVSALNQFI